MVSIQGTPTIVYNDFDSFAAIVDFVKSEPKKCTAIKPLDLQLNQLTSQLNGVDQLTTN